MEFGRISVHFLNRIQIDQIELQYLRAYVCLALHGKIKLYATDSNRGDQLALQHLGAQTGAHMADHRVNVVLRVTGDVQIFPVDTRIADLVVDDQLFVAARGRKNSLILFHENLEHRPTSVSVERRKRVD